MIPPFSFPNNLPIPPQALVIGGFIAIGVLGVVISECILSMVTITHVVAITFLATLPFLPFLAACIALKAACHTDSFHEFFTTTAFHIIVMTGTIVAGTLIDLAIGSLL